ncbi:hypothetical protein [Microbacterium sp. GXS0129]|uniref:hypothetical protein n=1 Tax=Microbacterium sp. GXS0129 TaxID=3377836 RepID=UPI00383A56BE
MGVTVTVTVDVNPGLDGEISAATVQGLNLAAERGLALTAERVPLDLGTLVGSGAVEPASSPEDGAAITYNTPYAVRLHEHPEYNFQNGRQGKYVEEPLLTHADELGAIIAAEVNRA